MKTLAERVLYIREQADLTQEAFGLRIGISKQSVNQIEGGATKTLRGETLAAIEKEFGYAVQWIVNGEGPMRPATFNTSEGVHVYPLPLISWVQAGHWNESPNMYRVGEGEKTVYTTRKVSARAYAVRVVGDSMVNPNGHPTFAPGAMIVVDPELQPENGSCVIFRMAGSDSTTFKQLSIQEDGTKWLNPLNPRYNPMALPEDAVYCGRVVQTIADNF
jgi:SOS-response transcriptional repressor LexA